MCARPRSHPGQGHWLVSQLLSWPQAVTGSMEITLPPSPCVLKFTVQQALGIPREKGLFLWPERQHRATIPFVILIFKTVLIFEVCFQVLAL